MQWDRYNPVDSKVHKKLITKKYLKNEEEEVVVEIKISLHIINIILKQWMYVELKVGCKEEARTQQHFIFIQKSLWWEWNVNGVISILSGNEWVVWLPRGSSQVAQHVARTFCCLRSEWQVTAWCADGWKLWLSRDMTPISAQKRIAMKECPCGMYDDANWGKEQLPWHQDSFKWKTQ